MGTPSSPPHEYYEGAEWEKSVDDAGLDFLTIDGKLSALTFAVARIPDQFPYVGDSQIQVAHYDGDPPLLVFFLQEQDGRIALLFLLTQNG